MERIHQLTKEFMTTAGQTVREYPSVPTKEEMKLRLTLELEELKEKAEAMGLEGTFGLMMWHGANKVLQGTKAPAMGVDHNISYLFDQKDTNEVNLVEVFDAALDQRVVASGTDLAFGFQHIIEAGDGEVHRSNMSKFDENAFDSSETTLKYIKEGVDTYTEMVGNFMVCKRSSDNKILKSHKYSPANLAPILNVSVNEAKGVNTGNGRLEKDFWNPANPPKIEGDNPKG